MQKVVTAAEMREIDRLTTEKYGIPSLLLMENAAHAAARVIVEKLKGPVKDVEFMIICGPGNNGGDGLALARVLWTLGAEVFVALIGESAKLKGDSAANFKMVCEIRENQKYEISNPDKAYINLGECTDIGSWKKFLEDNLRCHDPDVIVDALFGTGLNRRLEGVYEDVAMWMRGFNVEGVEQDVYVVSLDVPSGLDSDKPLQIGINPRAHLTVTFTAPKPANVLPPTSNFNGELATVNIGSPPELVEDAASKLFLTEKRDLKGWLSQTNFEHDSYKNKRGHSLIIAGSENYSGAAVLAADACMRSGVGLVTLATPKSVKDSIAARVLPEIMTIGLAETENNAISEDAFAKVEKLMEKAHCVALGCGLSSDEEETRNFVSKVVENCKTPLLLDADALNALSPFQIKGDSEHPLILTPHIGEMKRLLGLKDQDELGELVPIVRDFAQKHHVILVLKGERVLIAEPGGKVVINPMGNSGLGKGGNGDTLAGIITGFVTQSFSLYAKDKSEPEKMNLAFEAVVAAVYIAGLAGDIAERKYGKRVMTASDVRECLVDAFNEIEKQ